MHPIVNEIQNLPPQAQQEVINFVVALVKKQLKQNESVQIFV